MNKTFIQKIITQNRNQRKIAHSLLLKCCYLLELFKNYTLTLNNSIIIFIEKNI